MEPADLLAGARLERIVMTNEVNAGHRVLGRLIGRELTDAEANEVVYAFFEHFLKGPAAK